MSGSDLRGSELRWCKISSSLSPSSPFAITLMTTSRFFLDKWNETNYSRRNTILTYLELRKPQGTIITRKWSESQREQKVWWTDASHITAESIASITIKPKWVQWRRRRAIGDAEQTSRSRTKEIIATFKEKETEIFPGFVPVFRIIVTFSIAPVTKGWGELLGNRIHVHCWCFPNHQINCDIDSELIASRACDMSRPFHPKFSEFHF